MPTLRQSLSRSASFLSLVLAFGAVVSLAGCGGGAGAKDVISGKVTMGGQAVSGQVVIVGSDKKEYPTPIGPDGGYSVSNVPAGEAQILVKGMGGAVTAPGTPGTKDKGKSDLGAASTAGGGVAPPAKYGLPSSPLKVNITGGNQKHDIALDP